MPSVTSAPVRAARLAGAAALIGALATAAPPPLIGAVAFAIGLVASVPQMAKSLGRSDVNDSAVSLLAWLLRVASQSCWLVYAVVLHDLTVTVSAAFLLSSALVVIAGELSRRPQPVPATVVALA